MLLSISWDKCTQIHATNRSDAAVELKRHHLQTAGKMSHKQLLLQKLS